MRYAVSAARVMRAMKSRMNRIKHWREFRGMEQDELADKVETSQSTISRLERGTVPLTVEMMQRIAYALDCNPADLISTAVVAEIRTDVEPHEANAEAPVIAALRSRGLMTYRVLTNVVEQTGIEAGAVILVDGAPIARERLKSGDIVVAFVRERTGKAEGLVLRQFLAPDLLTTHRAAGRDVSIKIGDPELDIEIKGVMEPVH